MKKPFWQSKTLWVNIIAIVVIVVDELAGLNILSTELQVSILAAANIILRLLTNTSLGK